MNILRWHRVLAALAFATTLWAFGPASTRASITLELDDEFSGATDPAGATPWLTATFDDSIGGGAVRLTMSTLGLVGSEFIPAWYFNLDPLLTPTALLFSAVDTADVDSVGISLGVNAFKADGDGYFDIKFVFANDAGDDRLSADETVIYDITYGGAGTFDENSFIFGSAPGGGNGTYYSAAKVQGIGVDGEDSGWIGAGLPEEPPPPGPGGGNEGGVIPEPTALIVWSLLMGSVSMIASRPRRCAVT